MCLKTISYISSEGISLIFHFIKVKAIITHLFLQGIKAKVYFSFTDVKSTQITRVEFMIKSLVAFIASYSFLFFILLLKNIEFILDAIFFHHTFGAKEFWVPVSLLAISLFCVLIYVLSLNLVSGDSSKVITKAKIMRGELMNYSVPYMVSFFGFKVGSWIDLATLFFFMFLIFIMQSKEKVTILNPIASMMNYGLYDCVDSDGSEFILMSKNRPQIGLDISIKDYGKGIFILKEDNESSTRNC